ncbi:MAG: type III pantothenate kinase [Crocinitomicaceae bacterium]|jgi:type III pantothenate kinase|nr:type III pantothenate kinase [Crocinitomicaceae bacterium]
MDSSIVIDAGNTRIKVGVFRGDRIQEVLHFGNEDWNALKAFLLDHQFNNAIVSSVRSEKDTKWILQLLPNPKRFTSSLDLPLNNTYTTPDTLGSDRLANVVAAATLAKSSALIIDIGTCVKFDIIDSNKTYLGGSISPGISLRYKSLAEHTGSLPLVDDFSKPNSYGDSTISCIHSGVMIGIQAEIDYFINYYSSSFEDLTIFVTGGDAHCFDFQSKNNIFVEQNLTLFGLFYSI